MYELNTRYIQNDSNNKNRLKIDRQTKTKTPYLIVNDSTTIPTQQSLPPYIINPTYNNNSLQTNISDASIINDYSFQNNLPLVSANNEGTIYYSDAQNQITNHLSSCVKSPWQKHLCIMILNFVLYAAIIGCLSIIIILNLIPWVAGQMIGFPYLVYLILTLCGNSLTQYLSNMKNFSQIQKIFNELKQRTGHIKLTIECYHFTSGRHRRRVVTHTATQFISIRLCEDQSQDLSNIKDKSSYSFCQIKRWYYFADTNSHLFFQNTLNMFTAANTQDVHQTVTHILDITIPGFQNKIGLSHSGTGCHLKPMFYICTILGLAYPYCLLIQCLTNRYQINCVKRLTI